MKRGRYHCIVCGKGFLAIGTDETNFCKKKCMMQSVKEQGKKWNPSFWRKRVRPMSKAEKLEYIKTIKFN